MSGPFRPILIAIAVVFTLGSCSRMGDFARRQADRDVGRLISDKQAAALGADHQAFEPDPAKPDVLKLVERARRLNLADDAFTTPTYRLSLADALAIAISNNRDYRTEREKLYATALALTGVRWDYGTIFNASASADYTRDGSGEGIEEIGRRGFTAGLRRQLATGANITVAYTHQFLHVFSRGGRTGAANTLQFGIVQPLLNGAGSLTAREPLRQSERDMVYAVRNFALYEQDFVIDAVSRYCALLKLLDRMHNARANYESVMKYYELLQIQVRHRVRSQLDADQALQQALVAESIWVDAQAAYQSQLEQFKIFLGVDLDLDLGPDWRELDDIRASSEIRPALSLAQSIDSGLANRLELRNARDREGDARRHVEIALRNFLPTLDARYDAGFGDQSRHGLGLGSFDSVQTVGFDFILPLDWTPRRNAYRADLIGLDQARRNAELQRDQIVADIREAWRELGRLSQQVRIARDSVALVQRRVEGTQMMLANGLTTAREMTDTQDELFEAQNDLTMVLIQHMLARLKFWRAIGNMKLTNHGNGR
ncbi:MAG: TolC family protein [Candidatus Sumerlaeia bacterium]